MEKGRVGENDRLTRSQTHTDHIGLFLGKAVLDTRACDWNQKKGKVTAQNPVCLCVSVCVCVGVHVCRCLCV